MTDRLQCISPIDGSVHVERPLADSGAIVATLQTAAAAQQAWKRVDLAERQALLARCVDVFVARKPWLAEEISRQMGRPLAQAGGEINGLAERARYMIDIAPEALADLRPAPKSGFDRFIRREPLGVVLVVAPWNYPYLTSVNSVVPALLAGNSVVLKHSAQTPLCAERYAECLAEAGLPEGVFQFLHMNHAGVEQAIRDSHTAFIAFTGSVPGGHAVQRAASERFIGTGLELGGKDPAYVRADADLGHAIENLVDGAFFNSGQSCCGIERIYVQREAYDEFIAGFVELTRRYRLGNPLHDGVTLGPMVRAAAADFVRGQIREAVAAGARTLIDPRDFPADTENTPYLAPQVLVDVDHTMRVMHEESFGPVVGIMPVESDEQAVQLMNASRYGLTASVWTRDQDAALRIGERLDTGTVFMNRCDYLDPALAWVGVKDSGHGCTLSSIGYEQLTRAKSFHLRA